MMSPKHAAAACVTFALGDVPLWLGMYGFEEYVRLGGRTLSRGPRLRRQRLSGGDWW